MGDLIPTSHHLHYAKQRATERNNKERDARLKKESRELILSELKKRELHAEYPTDVDGEHMIVLEGERVPLLEVVTELRAQGVKIP